MKFVIFLAVAAIAVVTVVAKPNPPNSIDAKPADYPGLMRLRRKPVLQGSDHPIRIPHRRWPHPDPIHTKLDSQLHPHHEPGSLKPINTRPTLPQRFPREAVAEAHIPALRDARPPPGDVIRDPHVDNVWYHLS